MNPTTALRTAALLAVAAGLGACGNMKNAEVNPRTVAIVKLTSAAGGTPQPNPQSPVQGVLEFSELRGITSVTGTVTGLKPNAPHGFHVHEKGDCSTPDFSSAGGHFNPGGQPHGSHAGMAHHAGDLPSLKADASGVAKFSFESKTISVGSGANDIVGRALIVHRDPDDFTTQPTGNAGARLACAVITRG